MHDGLVAEYFAAVAGLKRVDEQVAALKKEALMGKYYLLGARAWALLVVLRRASEALGKSGPGLLKAAECQQKRHAAAEDLKDVVCELARTSGLFDGLRRECVAAAMHEQAILTVGMEADLTRVRHKLERVVSGLTQLDAVV